MRAIFLFLAAALVLPMAGFSAAGAQQVESYSEVELRDGGTLFGRVIERGERVRVVVDGGDTIDLPGSQVARVRDVRGRLVGGRFFRADPNETRLFFGPTGRTLPAGDAYLGVFELYLPFLAVGVTDRITLAGGAPLIFGEGMPFVLYLAPKVQLISSDRLTGSVGSLSFLVEDESFGVVYGVMTSESANGMSSFTFGSGWGYADGDVTDRPVIMAGGDLRVSRAVKLLSENYVVVGEDLALFSFGLRFVGERLSADVGLAVPSEGGIALPLVNFVYSF